MAQPPATPTPNPTPTPPPTPPPSVALEVKGGLLLGFNPSKRSEYHSFTYKGKSLTSSGEAPKALVSNGLFSLPDKSASTPTTSVAAIPSFHLDIFSGSGTLKGDLFDALNLNDFAFRKINLGKDLKPASQFAGSFDGRTLGGAIGVERQLPYGLRNLGLSSSKTTTSLANWLIPGIMLNSDKGGSTTGIFTYRGFLGKSFNWKQSRWLEAAFNVDTFLGKYPNFENVKTASDAISEKQKKANAEADKAKKARKTIATTAEEDFIVYIAHNEQFIPKPNETPQEAEARQAQYASEIRKMYNNEMNFYLQQPSSAVWLESRGWYTGVGDPKGSRWKPLVALVLTQWQDTAQTSRSQIQLRYEYGYNRAEPTVRNNRLLISYGINL